MVDLILLDLSGFICVERERKWQRIPIILCQSLGGTFEKDLQELGSNV